MEKIISDFGVQPVYLAAQAFNFIILLLVLKKFLYRPILKVINERKTLVSDSLVKAETIDQRFQATEEESAKQLAETSKEAQKIIDKAKNTANQIIADAHNKAQLDIEKMIDKSKQEIQLEREKMRTEMYEELANLIVLGVKKVSSKLLHEPDHLKVVDETVAILKYEYTN